MNPAVDASVGPETIASPASPTGLDRQIRPAQHELHRAGGGPIVADPARDRLESGMDVPEEHRPNR